jgi:hypothetical protein
MTKAAGSLLGVATFDELVELQRVVCRRACGKRSKKVEVGESDGLHDRAN